MKRNVLSACKIASKRIAGLLMVGMFIFSSCYNDDDLKNSISGLENRVTELEASMKAVQSDISSLQTLTEALGNKKTIASVLKNEDGSYTIKFSDNDEIVIRNGEAAPAITILEEEGVYYWALTGADGNKTFLTDGSGKKMPVTAVAPQVRINAQTKEWEISTDGGKTWSGTDVIASGSGDASLFKEVTDDTDYVYFTLADGTELKVVKSKELKCNILSGKQYFSNDEEKMIKVEMSGISKYTVTKPDGWKVSLSGEGLKVTAPAAENAYAETGGKVAIVAVAANGQSVISEIAVVLGEAPVQITIDKTAVSTVLATGVDTYYFGVSKSEEYSADHITAILNGYGARQYMKTEALAGVELKELLGADPEAGASYMLWAVPVSNDDLLAEDLIVATIKIKPTVLLGVTDITFKGATVSVTRKGCSKYYVGIETEAYYNPNDILDNLSWSTSLANDYNGSMLGYDFAGLTKVDPGTTYVVWIIPVMDERGYDYTVEDIIMQKIEIPALTSGGSATVTVGDVTSETTSVSATLTPSADCVLFYYSYILESNIGNYASDQNIIDYLIKSGNSTEETAKFLRSGMEPDTKGYIVAVAVTADGKVGELVKKEANSKPITYSTTVSVAAEASSLEPTSVTIALTVTGTPVKYRYIHMTKTEFQNNYLYRGNDDAAQKALVLNNYGVTEIEASSLTDKKLVLDGLLFETDYVFFLIAVDANGDPSRELAKVAYTTAEPIYVRVSDPAWAAAAPTVVANPVLSGKYYNLNYTVTPGPNCKEMYIYINSDEAVTGMFDQKIRTIISRGTKAVDVYSGTKYSMLPTNIFVTWVDNDGKYYEVQKTVVEKPVE